MFALGIQYLNGWAMAAADGPRKQQAEWPPHPDRVFMALAAAWFETGEDTNEGAALRWLERLDPPAIAASDASQRISVVSYVPVNDVQRRRLAKHRDLSKLKKAGLALLPEHRPRQPRSFPVAIPHEPTVHLIWQEAELGSHRHPLERLAAKVTHVGHSASLTQVWVETDADAEPNLQPAEGLASHRLRVPIPGRLDQLANCANRKEWCAYKDMQHEIENAKEDLRRMKPPPRAPWRDFPDAVLLASESVTTKHPQYAAAKSGKAVAAAELVDELVRDSALSAVRHLIAEATINEPSLIAAHAYERSGYNAIPSALAKLLGDRLGLPFHSEVGQTNLVGHTGADGYGRLARQAAFDGPVEHGRDYVMVDDFIGQGGTMANLRGWVEKKGGNVVAAVALTGKPYSARLNPTKEQLNDLTQKHGQEFERWWREFFGHAFNCLTQSEARYLTRSPDVDTIRIRLAHKMRGGGGPSDPRSPKTQRRHIKELSKQLAESFPNELPHDPRPPVAARWQGYGPPQTHPPDTYAATAFDSRIVVLALRGQRLPLSATLKLTAALRGLLMSECPAQPPPEWFSGHRAGGAPSREAHMALVPLAFVGSPHANGSIMGIGLVLPRALQPAEAGNCLETILRSTETGLPREDLRLFDGRWLSCRIELETRERPPWNLAPAAWTGPARTWASVTPVVLNRHFDGQERFEKSAESLKDACQHIGLPRPSEVLLHTVSLVEGAPHAREFPHLVRSRDGGRQRHTHAVIIFDEPVAGPVLIGAGRFRGYGLCRPMDKPQDRGRLRVAPMR